MTQKLVHMHQPHFLPSVQYFYRMAVSDVFLFADNVQHERAWWEHRNRIMLDRHPHIVALSLVQSDAFSRIDQTPLFQAEHTLGKITHTLYHAYHRSTGWPIVEDLCVHISDKASVWTSLADCNIDLTLWLANKVGINTPVHRWSDYPLEPDEDCDISWRTDRVARYAELFQCTHFLYGKGTAGYLERAAFERRGIELVPDTWQPRPYPQRSDSFFPNLSIVDLLAQQPDDALQYLGSAE